MTDTMTLPEEAIAAAASWWAKVLENPKFDALGGERDRAMEFAQVLMTMGNRTGPRIDTEKFRAALADGIRRASRDDTRFIGVDYDPDRLLEDAARAAGVANTAFIFPIKTSMWLDADCVRVRYGYGAEIQTIWEAPRATPGPEGDRNG
jgi:hypothetical protein